MIAISVRGKPTPQGSHKAFVVGGRARITDSNKNLRAWRDLVAACAQSVAPDELLEGPIRVEIEFLLARPKSLPKKIPDWWHVKKPDVDKLTRAILDALTGIVFRDDSQVVEVVARKSYGTPGAEIVIAPVGGTNGG